MLVNLSYLFPLPLQLSITHWMLLLQVMTENRSKLTRTPQPLMSLGLRLYVPICWVLIFSSAFATASTSSSSVSQLWLAVPTFDILIENTDLSSVLVNLQMVKNIPFAKKCWTKC